MDHGYAQLEQIVSASALLGYLNFSDGRPDPRWQKQLNEAYAFLAEHGEAAPWQAILDWLSARLRDAARRSSTAAFRDVTQAETVLAWPTAYCRPIGVITPTCSLISTTPICSALLSRARFRGRPGSAWPAEPDEGDKTVPPVVARLNDFVGHRPIAILETRPQGEPYDHERHRPLPLYLKGAGVAYGPLSRSRRPALWTSSRRTDPALLAEAQFDLELLDELAVDLRAYDHGHPVNRRPNYVFGEWDPHHLDNQGRFRRYVVRKITLDALLDRIELTPGPTPRARGTAAWKAAAVLAGTILMATGISGNSPTAHDSTTTLATLLPRIARYRDVFYEHLLKDCEGIARRPGCARKRRRRGSHSAPHGSISTPIWPAIAPCSCSSATCR